MINNETIIIFSKNNIDSKKITNNAIKSKIISNLKKAEKLLDEQKFKKLQKDLIINLKENNTINVIIKKNNYKLNIETEEEIIPSVNSNDSTYIEDDDNEIDILEDYECKKYDIVDEQTYLFDADLSDEEESIIDNAIKLKDKYNLKSLNTNELRNVMKNKNLKISKYGTYFTKSEMIEKIEENLYM